MYSNLNVPLGWLEGKLVGDSEGMLLGISLGTEEG